LLKRLTMEVFYYVFVHRTILVHTVDLGTLLTFASRLYCFGTELVIQALQALHACRQIRR
jgi:hypothetical protein